jgi:hypothetical protein
MAVSINWATKVINVPRADMLLIQSTPTEIRQLDIDAFRLELKSLEASVEGMSFLDTHQHNPPVTVGGVTLARVVEIINGYTITFEDGQYAVNLVGANSNIADVTNVNQVSVRSANSAGLTYSKEVEDQSFYDSRVFIDTIDGRTGVQFPRGTPGDPTNNYDDGRAIVDNRTLAERYWLKGELILDADETLSNQDWLGFAPNISKINMSFTPQAAPHTNPGTLNTVFKALTLTGTMNGPAEIENSILDNVSGFEGTALSCGLNGTITFPGFPADDLYSFVDCFSLIPGTSTPIIDMNGATGAQLQLRRYAGGIELRNCTDSNNVISVDLTSGHLKLDSTVTAGTIVVRGTGHITDNSSGATVITNGFTPVWTESEKNSTLVALTSIADVLTLLQKYEENRSVIDKTANTLTIYDDDDVTPILVFSLLDSTGTPSTDEVAERVPQ